MTSSPTEAANSGSISSRKRGLLSRSGLISSRSMLPSRQPVPDRAPLLAVGAVDGVRAQPEPLRRRDLVAHEREQRADDEGRARRRPRAAAPWPRSTPPTCPSPCAARTAPGRGRPPRRGSPRAARGETPPPDRRSASRSRSSAAAVRVSVSTGATSRYWQPRQPDPLSRNDEPPVDTLPPHDRPRRTQPRPAGAAVVRAPRRLPGPAVRGAVAHAPGSCGPGPSASPPGSPSWGWRPASAWWCAWPTARRCRSPTRRCGWRARSSRRRRSCSRRPICATSSPTPRPAR